MPAAAAPAAPVDAEPAAEAVRDRLRFRPFTHNAVLAQEKPKEKTMFNVKLESFEATSKPKVIKEVKAIVPNLNLIEVSARSASRSSLTSVCRQRSLWRACQRSSRRTCPRRTQKSSRRPSRLSAQRSSWNKRCSSSQWYTYHKTFVYCMQSRTLAQRDMTGRTADQK